MSDFSAGARDRWGDSTHGLITDQIADVGDHPGGAGFYELVVVELVEIVANNSQLFSHQHQQRLQRPASGFGKQRIELLLLHRGQRRRQHVQRV